MGVSCRNLYSFVVYLYVNGSGSITSVGGERANLCAVVYLCLCGFCLALRKHIRIDSVMSVNLYKISFLSLVLNIYKNSLSILKHISIRLIFGKNYYR